MVLTLRFPPVALTKHVFSSKCFFAFFDLCGPDLWPGFEGPALEEKGLEEDVEGLAAGVDEQGSEAAFVEEEEEAGLRAAFEGPSLCGDFFPTLVGLSSIDFKEENRRRKKEEKKKKKRRKKRK